MEKELIDTFADLNKKLDEQFAKIDRRFENIDQRFENIDQRFENIENKIGSMDLEIRKINLTLENEIKPAITVLGEGHQMLVERMDRMDAKIDSLTEKVENNSLRIYINDKRISDITNQLAN
ncbi:MAG: hypothetical protein IKE18_03540 [Oscillospiraceae bacterium]|nr:hypothetical protein [Oscillospiraceae bacterium]